MYTPVNPGFTIIKWGLLGKNYIGMFSRCPSEKGSMLKGYNLLPSKLFPLRADALSKGIQNNLTELFHLKVYEFLLNSNTTFLMLCMLGKMFSRQHAEFFFFFFFLYFFQQNSLIVYADRITGNNLPEMLNPIFWVIQEKIIILSAEFTQRMPRIKQFSYLPKTTGTKVPL